MSEAQDWGRQHASPAQNKSRSADVRFTASAASKLEPRQMLRASVRRSNTVWIKKNYEESFETDAITDDHPLQVVDTSKITI